MGISSVNIAMNASYGAYNQKLSQATKQILEELGIPHNPNISENDAKKLIESHKSEKHKNTNQQSLFQGDAQTSDLIKKAKKLAKKLGVQIPDDINFQQIIALIETNLEQKINSNKNNINMLKELKSLSQELAFIQAQGSGGSGYDNTNQALMTSLEMLSMYNKHFIKNN